MKFKFSDVQSKLEVAQKIPLGLFYVQPNFSLVNEYKINSIEFGLSTNKKPFSETENATMKGTVIETDFKSGFKSPFLE